MDGLTIRRAVADDAPALAALSGVLGYPVGAGNIGERLGRVLQRSDDTVLVAETASGELAGWLHGAAQTLMTSGRSCELLALVVGEPHRRSGVGRRLVAALEAWAAERGLAQMTVRSNVVRPESHAFYERLDYQRVKTQHVYRKPVPTAVAARTLNLEP